MERLKNWFKCMSLTGKVTSIAVALLLSFGAIGAAAEHGTSAPTVAPNAELQGVMTPTPKIETKNLSTTEPIPFTSSTIEDGALDQGVLQTRTKGVDGVKTHTYTVTYTNGVETSRSEPVDVVSTPAVNEVIAKGTKAPVTSSQSCPNGTYTNSVGNIVCSPYASSAVPAGASAQCVDGTYSFSQHRSGTCSHHGGVSVWY